MSLLYSQMTAHTDALLEAMTKDKRILAMTADLVSSCKLEQVEKECPGQFFNVGIAEQNMLSVAAGLSLEGFRPVTHTFSVFSSLRACEQLRTDIFYNRLPVTVIGTHGGVSTGAAGSTHYALEDMAVVRSMPGSKLFCPSDDISTTWVLETVLSGSDPAYIRLDRNPLPRLHSGNTSFEIGTPVTLRGGDDIALFACGSMTERVMEAASILSGEGIESAVFDCISVKPLCGDAILKAVTGKRLVFTVEEHSLIGGLGSAISELLSCHAPAVPLIRIGIPDLFPKGGPVEAVRNRYGLNAGSIVEKVRSALP